MDHFRDNSFLFKILSPKSSLLRQKEHFWCTLPCWVAPTRILLGPVLEFPHWVFYSALGFTFCHSKFFTFVNLCYHSILSFAPLGFPVPLKVFLFLPPYAIIPPSVFSFNQGLGHVEVLVVLALGKTIFLVKFIVLGKTFFWFLSINQGTFTFLTIVTSVI